MSIRFGVSPIAWSNDDLPELGGQTPLSSCLRDMRDLGFDGTELGNKFPRETLPLRQTLGEYELELVGGWWSTNLLNQEADEEFAAAKKHISLLRDLGSDIFIAAETSNAIHGLRHQPMQNRPHLSASEWNKFCARMDNFAHLLSQQGMKLAYHHHMGTVIENGEDIEKFLSLTNPNVGITLDTGHAHLAGADPLRIISTHSDRVAHVHCKDVRNSIARKAWTEGLSFLDGVVAGMFTVPGDGDIEFEPVMQSLKDLDYASWIIIEAEQDPAKAAPRQYAEMGLKSIRKACENVGLV